MGGRFSRRPCMKPKSAPHNRHHIKVINKVQTILFIFPIPSYYIPFTTIYGSDQLFLLFASLAALISWSQ